MKLTKMFLVLASLGALFVATDGATLAAPVTFTVSTSVIGNCLVSSAGDITFPAYDPLSTSATTANADVTIKCTVNQVPKISLDYGVHGGAGLYNYMKASGSTDTLQYQIFQPTGPKPASNSGTQWNGKQFTGAAAPATTPIPAIAYTMYGQIPAGQNVSVDSSYSDTVTVTVDL